MRIRFLLAAGVATAASVAMASSALAATQTVSGSVGSYALPNVPVQVCVNSRCSQTPPLKSVFMWVTAKSNGSIAPTVTPGPCASRLGGTLAVTAGPTGAEFVGYVSGTHVDGRPFLQFFPAVAVPPNAAAIASACASPPSSRL